MSIICSLYSPELGNWIVNCPELGLGKMMGCVWALWLVERTEVMESHSQAVGMLTIMLSLTEPQRLERE